MVYVFFMVGRGLAVLDDYQNLPVTSLLAAGDIPPRFALDPEVSFNYHYLVLLFSGQIMRIGNMYPWLALDLARAIGFSIGLMLTGLYVQRITWSKMAGVVAGLVAAFGGGTRWLMLLLPGRIIDRMSDHLQMLGAYANFSGLSEALVLWLSGRNRCALGHPLCLCQWSQRSQRMGISFRAHSFYHGHYGCAFPVS